MTAYTGLVTLVQLSASTIGDKNPVTYDAGVSVIKNVLKAAKRLKEEPNDLDARGNCLNRSALICTLTVNCRRKLLTGLQQVPVYHRMSCMKF